MNDVPRDPNRCPDPFRFRRHLVGLMISLLPALSAGPVVVSGVDISRWRGFNLLEHYNVGRETDFRENDFTVMAREGFNFARLPLDYAIYEDTNAPGTWRAPGLAALDAAIDMGRKHKVHVCINLHKAPGYCVNLNPRRPDLQDQLWTDAAVQDRCIATWVMLAKRYRKVPASDLSFNLLNEPSRVAASNFIPLMKRMVGAIHAVSPSRIIVMDGMEVGSVPQAELYSMPNVVTAIRGYAPGTLTHYKAEWTKGSDRFPMPEWPMPATLGGFLYGPDKADVAHGPVVLNGPFPPGTQVAFVVDKVSRLAQLVVRADGRVVFGKDFIPGPGVGEWKEVVEKSGMYQNVYDRGYSFFLTNGVARLEIENTNGDWLRVSSYRIEFPGAKPVILPTDARWGRKPGTLGITTNGPVSPDDWSGTEPVTQFLAPWKAAQTNGAKLFVGEMGVYKHTPHDVTLRWFKTCLDEYRSMNIGWALWNFRGTMGVADSDRADATYETVDGMKVDVKMMALLKSYPAQKP